MPTEITNKVAEFISTGVIWSFGGASFYLYKVSKWQSFKFWMFLINLILAFFIGYVIGKFLEPSNYRDGIIAISGFSSFPILELLEKKWFLFFAKATGLNDDNSHNSNN